MNLTGTITSMSSVGIWARIPELKTEYGPLPYLGLASDYAVGAKVLVVGVGADEYIVVGRIRP